MTRLLSACARRNKGRGKWRTGTGAVTPPPVPDDGYIVTEPAGAENGVPFTTQPVLQMQKDGADLARGGFESTVSIATGTGTLGRLNPPVSNPLQAVSDSSGRYNFADIFITGSGNHTLAFSGGAGGFPDSASFNVSTPSVQTQLGITTQPGNAVTSTIFGVQPVIQLQDASGASVAASGVSVTAAIATGPGVLTTTLSVNTDSNGTATFTDLEIDTSANHSIIFTSGVLTSVTSIVFGVSTPNPGTIVSLDFNNFSSAPAMTSLGVNRSGGSTGVFPFRKHDYDATGGRGGTGAIKMTWFTGMSIGFSPTWITIPGGWVPHYRMNYHVLQSNTMVHPGSSIKLMRQITNNSYQLGTMEWTNSGVGGGQDQRLKWLFDNFAVQPGGPFTVRTNRILCAWDDVADSGAGCSPKLDGFLDGAYHEFQIECNYNNLAAATIEISIDGATTSQFTLPDYFTETTQTGWIPAVGSTFNVSPFAEMYSSGEGGSGANINSGTYLVDDFSFTVLP